MTIWEQITKNVTTENKNSWFYPQELLNLFEIYDSIDSEKLKIDKFWYHSWMCTDTYVGIAVYVFDGEILAISFKPYRKYNETYYFKDQESAQKLKKHLLELRYDQDNDVYETFSDMEDIISLAESIDHKKFETKNFNKPLTT